MKKAAKCVMVVALFCWPLMLAAQSEEYYRDSYARLSYVKGSVVVVRASDLGSEEGVVNLALIEGDKLTTGDGRAEVGLGRKNYLRLDRGSEVEFSNLPRRGDDRTRLHLLAGRIYLRINFLQEEKTFEVHTPDASFYVLENGLFRFDVRENRETELMVLEGSVEAAGESGSQLISGRESLVASNGHLGTQGGFSYGRDDFDSWNEDRDALYNQYVAKKYLPAELDDYEYELSSNGYWAYERPFGYVWVPHVYYNDWRPYHYGRWLWYPNCGWNWISYEPWGWCTYHYGRWHWRLGLGWYWIPHTHWGPAWVHWYSGYDYIGWSPLSWYNRPVVILNNYFYDRYHSPHYPGGSRALTVVHRNQLQNPNIHHVALSRNEASRLGQISLESRQPDIKPTVNRAGLQKVSPARLSPQSQVKQFGRSPVASGGESPSRANRVSPAAGQDRTPESGGITTNRKASPGSLGSGRSVSSSPSLRSSSSAESRPSSAREGGQRVYAPSSKLSKSGTSSSSSPARSAPETSSSSPRKIRSDSNASGRVSSSGSPSTRSGVKSYSPSSRTSSSSEGRPSSARKEISRVYAPSSSLSRFGTGSGSGAARSPRNSLPSPGSSRIKEWSSSGLSKQTRSGYHDSPWTFTQPSSPRLESSSSRSSSYSSPSRSIFSAPRSSSPSRSPSFSRPSSSRPSSSRSTPGFSSGSRSSSSPSRSSSVSRSSSPSRSSAPSRGSSSSGRVSKRNG